MLLRARWQWEVCEGVRMANMGGNAKLTVVMVRVALLLGSEVPYRRNNMKADVD